MFAVPGAIPVMIPELEPIVATDKLLLVHETPPDVASVSVVVPPVHILVTPEIAAGSALTTTE